MADPSLTKGSKLLSLLMCYEPIKIGGNVIVARYDIAKNVGISYVMDKCLNETLGPGRAQLKRPGLHFASRLPQKIRYYTINKTHAITN